MSDSNPPTSTDNSNENLRSDTWKDTRFRDAAKWLHQNKEGFTAKQIGRFSPPLISFDTLNRTKQWTGEKAPEQNPGKGGKLRKDGTNGFSQTARSAAKLLFDPYRYPLTYYLISRFAYQSAESLARIEKSFLGQFTYFRFFKQEDSSKKFDYVSGRIEIYMDGMVPKVKHWSSNHLRRHNEKCETNNTPNLKVSIDQKGYIELGHVEPLHQGYAFFLKDRLVLLLRKKLVLRLVTAYVDPDDTAETPFTGLVNSITESDYPVGFSARFVMAKSTSNELWENYAGADGEQKFKEEVQEAIFAENAFLYEKKPPS